MTGSSNGGAAPPDRIEQVLLDRLERLPVGRFHWILIATIFLGTAFDNMDQITLSFVIPEYRREWGISAAQASLHPAFGLLGTLIGAFVWGWIADRIGRKAAFIWTIVLFAATSLLNGFAWSFPQMVATCFIMGLGVGGEIPLAFTLISEYTPARLRGRAEVLTGMLAIAGGYAIAAASAFIFLPFEGQRILGHTVGWRTIFLVGVIPAILIAIIRRYVPESPRWLLAHGRVEEALTVVEGLERQAGLPAAPRPVAAWHAPAVHSNPGRSPTVSPVAAIWSPQFRSRTLMLSLYGVAWGFFNFGFLVWLPTLLQGVGYTAVRSAQYAFVLNAMAIPAAFVTAWLFERWSTRWTLTLYPLIAAALMLIFGGLADARLLTPLVLIATGAVIFATGAALAGLFPPYASEIYPTHLRATGAGWATSFSRLGAVTGPLVGGALVSAAIGPFGQTAVFGGALLIPALAMLVGGIETRRKRLEEIAA